MGAEDEKKIIRVAYGPISLVKAIPSREVSVIYIEVPEEMHVEVTNLVYRRDVLITLSKLVNVSYGVLDPHLQNTVTPEENATSIDQDKSAVCAVHGQVVTVKAVASRGVSVIAVEVPEEAHVDVTQMLYGREVLVMPVSLGSMTPYGIVNKSGKGSVHKANPRAGTASPANTNLQENQIRSQIQTSPYPQRTPHGDHHPSSAMIRIPQPLDIVRWLALKCSEDEFQDFLNVRNEAQAIDMVRSLCGINTRKELKTNQEAKKIFMDMIYQPFNNRNFTS